MSGEFKIECEYCDAESVIIIDHGEEPMFCPMCGRRSDPSEIEEDTEYEDYDD